MIDWSEVFEYDENVVGCLRWKINRGKKIRAGSVAGTKHSAGYWQVSYEYKLLLAHRVVYAMFYGAIPEGYEVDHKNGVRVDNRYENLRCVPKVINCRNSKQRSNNTSGITGVGLATRRGKLYWTARHVENGVNKQRTFSVDKHGYEGALQLAVEARDLAITSLNAKGYRYSARHGRKEL